MRRRRGLRQGRQGAKFGGPGQPIRFTPEEHQRLNELREKIDPEVLKRIDVLADAE